MNRSRFLLGSALAVCPSLAGAQQESPLTDEMVEKRKTGKVSEEIRALGAEFRNNPPWLVENIRAREADQAAEESGDEKNTPGYLPGYRNSAGLGLSPLLPQQGTVLPGGVAPAMGAPTEPGNLRFDFHGYLQAGLRAGIGERANSSDGQQTTTLHGDPVVAGGAFGWFEHTNTAPVPWSQLNFSFGNDTVQAHAILAAWSMTASDEAAGYFQPPSKLWFNNAYLSYTPETGPVGLAINAGVFTERYGAMAEYHSGAYGAALIAQIYGMGASSTVTLPFENEVTVTIEGSFKGDFNTAPPELVLDQSNEFTPTIEGSTYAAHGHLALDFDGWVELTGHGVYTFSQDDRPDEIAGDELYLQDRQRRDGSMSILGIDARFRLRRFGHLYIGGSRVDAEDSQSLSNLVQVLNNGPGRDMVRRYFSYDSGGNGSLTLLGGQYDLSLGTLLRYPRKFHGDAPDLDVSLFGIFGRQENDGDVFSNTNMLKFGSELTYGPLKWLALAGRFDSVMPDLDDSRQSFAVLTPRIIFRNDWDSQATLTFQYSGYLLGSEVVVRGDERLLNIPSELPDAHLLALYGTIWW